VTKRLCIPASVCPLPAATTTHQGWWTRGSVPAPCSHLSNRLMIRDSGVVKALLEGGAEKAATNKDGKTPMDFAKLAHQDEVMKLLA